MVLFVGIMFLTYVGVAHEGLHKTVAALLGGILLVLLSVMLGVFEYVEVYGFLAKDLNVFGVIIGTGILVDVTGKSGLRVRPETVDVFRFPAMVSKGTYPAPVRFGSKNKINRQGFSDHFPITLTIREF